MWHSPLLIHILKMHDPFFIQVLAACRESAGGELALGWACGSALAKHFGGHAPTNFALGVAVFQKKVVGM